MSQELLPWVDLETFGLNENFDPIIEVGIVLTDFDLTIIEYENWFIWSDLHYKRIVEMEGQESAGTISDGDKWVLKQHRDSGLFDEAAFAGRRMDAVEIEICQWLKDNDATGLPMCGSSVHFDQRFIRAQMPSVLDLFFRRIIDTSSLKELCARYNPAVFANVPPKQEAHRALRDIGETLEEFRFYRDNFLFDARP